MASAQGTVVAPQVLTSPVSGKPCLWYSLKVTSERKDGNKTHTGTLADDKVAAQFSIDDGSGPLFIDAKEGGDFEPCETFRDSKKIGLLGGIMGKDLQFGNYTISTGILALGTEYKVEEKVLPVVPTLYVNGKMSQQGANVLSKPTFPRSMIISNKSRDEVLGAAQAGAKYALLGGAGSAVVGTILGVVSSFVGGGDAKADSAVASASAPVAAASAPMAAAPVDSAPAAAMPAGKPAAYRPSTGAKPAAPTGAGTGAPKSTGDAKAPPAPADTKTSAPAGGSTGKPAGGKPPAKPPAGGKPAPKK